MLMQIRVGVLTNSAGLPFAALTPETAARIKSLVPFLPQIGNKRQGQPFG